MAPTFRSRFGQPSSRRPTPGATALSTVEWQSAHVIPSCTIRPAAVTFAFTPTTASPSQHLDRRGWAREVGSREEVRGQPRSVHLQADREGGDGSDGALHDVVE